MGDGNDVAGAGWMGDGSDVAGAGWMGAMGNDVTGAMGNDVTGAGAGMTQGGLRCGGSVRTGSLL